MVEQIRTRMTATEFLKLPEAMNKHELINGEVIVSPAPIPKHQRLVLRLATLIDSLKPNGEVIISPADVYLDDETVVQPDVFWIAEGGQCVETDTDFQGAPDLVAEVLSPGTAIYDKREKFGKYQEHGVGEYWLVDPQGEYVEVWILKDKAFERQGVFAKEDTFTSALLGKKVILSKIFG